MEEKTDSELVVQARAGDKEAFGALVRRYQSLALSIARRMVTAEDIARDMAQEAVLQAWLSLDRLHDPERFRGWLCGIVLNVCRSYLRNRKAGLLSLEAMQGGLRFDAVPVFSTAVTPEQIAEERELHEIVMAVIDELSPADRDVTLLFYYRRLSLREIAVLRGVSVGAVRVRLHRARRRLKDSLLSDHPEIVPLQQRRKKMIKVNVADVIRQAREDGHVMYVIVLHDESGKRALPVWVGAAEGTSIAVGLGGFSAPRPLTYGFFANLLEAVGTRLEEVRIETLKESTFYAVVKVSCGGKTREVDARPSDAIALAVITGSPVLVAADVMESAGIDIPPEAVAQSSRSGVEDILADIPKTWQRNSRISPEEAARAKEELITAVFGG